MNNKSIYIALFILPVIFLISGILLKSAQGPYYLNFYDPSYVYLINSLNLAQLTGIGHFDHPGSTVQEIGAVTVKLYHWFSNKNSDIAIDVLKRPEEYLSVMNKVFICINSLLLFLLGWYTFRVSKNIFLSLLIQLSPFVSMEIFYGLFIVTPENFLIAVMICFLCALIFYLYKIDTGKSSPPGFVVVFAVICGIGLATKLNFLPFVFIPFILIKGLKNKIMFLLITFFSFLIFIYPVLSNYNRFLEWIEKLFLYSGHYGSGSADIIDSSAFGVNLKMIFEKDIVFTVTYFIMLLTLILIFIRRAGFHSKENKILLTIFLAENLQIIMVAKHYAQYYLIPSFMMCIFSLALCTMILLPLLKINLNKFSFNKSYVLIFTIVAVWSLNQIIFSYKVGTEQKNEAFKIEKFINENYPGETVIAAFGSASKECALAFSVSYAAGQTGKYNSILTEIQTDHLFYNPWVNSFHSISKNDNIKNSLLKNEKIILQINNYGTVNKFLETLNKTCGTNISTFKKVYTNGNQESVYEINTGGK